MKVKKNQKIALITGSSRGIGRAIAFDLHKAGYRVVVHGSQPSEALSSVAAEIRKLGGDPLITSFDIGNPDRVRTASAEILRQISHVDILVNNASVVHDTPLQTMTDEIWNHVVRTNLDGLYFVTKAFLPSMKEQKFGRIINLSSIAVRGAYGKTNYAAAKAGVIGFTKSLALEVGKDNITVNAICPGYIDTEMSAKIPEKYRQQFLKQIALGRIGTPEEVAHVVKFLVSDEGSYVTGAVIDVNGGWL